MEIITLTKDNLEKEHICCAISSNKDCQVASKKQWLYKRFDDGLVFKKCDVRGKCFIEYIPAEKAWAPIDADGYMYINCLWVSGKLLVMLSSKKKLPFLSDPKFLRYKGFVLADIAEPFYELLYLPFEENLQNPRFKDHVKEFKISIEGFVLYFTNQCPFTAKYVPLIENIAKQKGIEFKSIRIETMEQAQNAPAPFTTYSLFHNGELLTNEILSINF